MKIILIYKHEIVNCEIISFKKCINSKIYKSRKALTDYYVAAAFISPADTVLFSADTLTAVCRPMSIIVL